MKQNEETAAKRGPGSSGVSIQKGRGVSPEGKMKKEESAATPCTDGKGIYARKERANCRGTEKANAREPQQGTNSTRGLTPSLKPSGPRGEFVKANPRQEVRKSFNWTRVKASRENSAGMRRAGHSTKAEGAAGRKTPWKFDRKAQSGLTMVELSTRGSCT